MARYLVIHSPRKDDSDEVRPPTRLEDLARAHPADDASPRWLKTWSPDLHDDRIFSLWDAASAAEIRKVVAEFGFLDDMDAEPINVREWGPAEVLSTAADDD